MKHFPSNFCKILVQSFLNFQSRVGWLFCKNNQKWPNTKRCLTPSIYKTPWEEKETRNVWPVINSMQWLILHSHWNNGVLNEWQLLSWRQNCWNSSRSNWAKCNKMNCFNTRSVTHNIKDGLVGNDEKRRRQYFRGVFSSTTKSYMVISNIFKTINLEEQRPISTRNTQEAMISHIYFRAK